MITLSSEKGLTRIETWDDVESRPGFTRDLDPRSAVLSEIIGQYHFKDLFPCGLAVCRQPHAKGYLVTTQDGRETNIGNLCGVRYFSVHFKELRKVFKASRLDQERRERVEAMKSRLPTLRAEIDSLRLGPPPLDVIQRSLNALRGQGGQLPRPVYEAARRCGRDRMGTLTRERMLSKEERDRMRVAQEASGQPARGAIPRAIEETVGHLEGFTALAPANDLRTPLVHVLEPAFARLDAVDVSALDGRPLASINKLVSQIDPALEQLREARASALRLLDPSNLAQLERLVDQAADRRQVRDFIATVASHTGGA